MTYIFDKVFGNINNIRSTLPVQNILDLANICPEEWVINRCSSHQANIRTRCPDYTIDVENLDYNSTKILIRSCDGIGRNIYNPHSINVDQDGIGYNNNYGPYGFIVERDGTVVTYFNLSNMVFTQLTHDPNLYVNSSAFHGDSELAIQLILKYS